MSASGTTKPTKYFGLEDYVDLVLEAADSEAGGQPVRFGCHKVEVAKAYKGFGDLLCKQELKVGDDGVKFVQITDVDSKTLDKILRHIYDEDIEDTELDAKLLEAAKLYELNELFRICLAATIPEKLTNANVLGAFKIANQLDLEYEKKTTFHFIWEHLEDLVATNEFKELMLSNPSLVMDFMVKSKDLAMSVQRSSSPQELENRISLFTSTRGLKRFEGDPVLIGTVCSKAGIQEFDLPSQLPKEAKGVRIIPVQYCDGRTRPVPNSFVKAWTLYRGTRSQHFIYRANQENGYFYQASSELFFPIDEKNWKIFADASSAVNENGKRITGYQASYVVHLNLVGYSL